MKKVRRTQSDKFLQIYNELDSFMRRELKLGDEADHAFMISEMARQGHRVFETFLFELRAFARLRNAIVHNPYQKIASPIAEPHPDIVKKYEKIVRLLVHQPKALSMAIPAHKIYTATLDTPVQEVMGIMLSRSYTHVPIIQDGKVVGVFSENTLFCYLASHKDALIMNDIKMQDFADFISFESHKNEYYEFINRETNIFEVEEIFAQGLKKLKRIAVVYVTENGNPSERLLGMITVWDLAGKRKLI